MKGFIAIVVILAVYAGTLLWKGAEIDRKKAMSFPSIYELHRENGVPVFTEEVVRGKFQQFLTLTGKFEGGVYKASITPQDRAKIKVGQEVLAEVGDSKIKLTGVVSRVADRTSLLTGLLDVEVRFPSHRALKGYFPVDVTYKSKDNVIIVSRDSVNIREEKPFVYIVDGNVLKKQEVKLGKSNAHYYEILSGLNGGEEIVSSDSRNLSDNLKIKVVNELRDNL
ncbi:MAG TPA: hypothetical protein VKZ84_08105 [Bacteriovoracaceae bacterium]|nr:hypothetical protein [Bacteriovoracaceae bacterium]